MKKYLANTAVSLSVTLPNGGYTRVSFSPLSDGTSVYYTNDKEIQLALEHHYKFGKLFRLVEDTEEQTAKKPAKPQGKKTGGKAKGTASKTPEPSKTEVPTEQDESSQADEAEETDTFGNDESEEEQEEDATPKEVTVSDLDAAKDYLAENFDVVRTKLKTEEIINDTALSFGIAFKYL